MSDLKAQIWAEPLSPREIEILSMISEGLSNREIAGKLFLSPETVKWYNKQIYAKLGVDSRTGAVAKAREYRLLEAPPARPVEEGIRPAHNLPAQLSSFVGRAREIAEIKALLGFSRLVVLTGPGGSGKTRLALQVAAELVGTYRDGVWLVELGSISDPSLVPNAIAQVLEANIGTDAPLSDVLKRFLARKHLLLLLDNFEHLPEATPLVGELLAAAPQVTVLATSRERLHVYGEQEYPVHPLNLPDLSRRETTEQLLAYDATRLFVQRARAVQPEFAPSHAETRAVAQVCVRLDGLPLALELAASQVKLFPPPTLAQRLQHSLGGLPAGPRDLPARQRTLRATIEWSYDLLNDSEKTLFARLAVFSGGGTVEAIERICGRGLPGAGIDALTALADKNLMLLRDGPDGERRFVMLETVREYALERLVASGEAERLRELHAAYFTDLAEQAQMELRTARQGYWFARLRAEQDNLRSVLSWSLRGTQSEYGLRLAAALRDYWYYAPEGLFWSELALEKADSAEPALRAGVLCTAGEMHYRFGDLRRGGGLQRQALEIYRQLGDERNAAWSRVFLSIFSLDKPDEIQQAIALCLDGLAVLRRLGDQPGIAYAFNILGELARMQGDDEAAKRYYEECLEIVKETGEQTREALQYANLSFIAYHQGQHPLAERLLKQALRIQWELANDYKLAYLLAILAGPVAALGAPERAARLLGASIALLEAMGAKYQHGDQPEVERYRDAVRQALGEEAFQAAWNAGQSMTLQEAIAFALGESA